MIRTVYLSKWFLLAVLGLSVLALDGCAMTRSAGVLPAHSDREIERNRFPVAKGDDVVGRLAVMKVAKGDTLPDIARHFSLGINALSAANPGVDVWVPEAGERVTLPLSFILPDAPRKGIVVNLATMRLFEFKDDGASQEVTTYPVGIGTSEKPTPLGLTRVARKAARPTWHVPPSIAEDHRKKGDPLPKEVPPGPLNPLGEYALYLSKSGYLIHGTNKPASIGLKASNGCMRLYPENVKLLFRDTPVNTPVAIVNQPYLIGQRDGVLYLEAHTPLEDPGAGAAELEKANARLRDFEKKSGRPLDWNKVKKVETEARGIPVPILETDQGNGKDAAQTIEIEHPDALYGRQELPELKREAWYVLAAVLRDETDAQRMAAMINHQGPPIPARVLEKDDRYRVVAGPFDDAREAKDALKRLRIDLEIDGILVGPDKKVSQNFLERR